MLPRPRQGPGPGPGPGPAAPRRRWLPALRSRYDREILRLALPALAALAAEPLFLLADSAIVGRLGVPQLAGLGIAGMVVQTVVGLFIFLAYATTAAVARRLGADDLPTALRAGIDGMWLALGIGVLLAVAGVLATPTVVTAFGPSPEVREQAIDYLQIAVLGMPAILVGLGAVGVLRGLQDTRTPMWVAGGSYLANIGLNLALVYGLDLGIAGSAYGTVIAQTGGAVVMVLIVVRGAWRNSARIRPDWRGVRRSFRAGMPLLIRTVTLRVALLVTTYVATSFGDTALAAHQVAFTLWSALSLMLDAIAIAGQAIVGRALGGADIGLTRSVTRRMTEWGVVTGIGFGIVLVLARPLYVPIFTTDQLVRHQLSTVIVVFALFLPAAGVVFVLDGVLIGAGDGRYLALAGVWTLVAYIPLAALVWAAGAGLIALWWAFGGFMLARMLTLLHRERGSAWLVTGARNA